MNDLPDYYSLLGLAPDATATEIKRAYRSAAKRHHPDAGGSADSMDAINLAYSTLSDPAKRHDYDFTRKLAADAWLAPQLHDDTADLIYQDMSALAHAEELRQQAEWRQFRREAWARQSGAGLLSSSLMWLVASVTLGSLAKSALVGYWAVIWTAINAAMIIAGSFGVVTLAWPEYRLILFDTSPFRKIYPPASWWWVLGIIIIVAGIAAIMISWAILG